MTMKFCQIVLHEMLDLCSFDVILWLGIDLILLESLLYRAFENEILASSKRAFLNMFTAL